MGRSDTIEGHKALTIDRHKASIIDGHRASIIGVNKCGWAIHMRGTIICILLEGLGRERLSVCIGSMSTCHGFYYSLFNFTDFERHPKETVVT